MLDGAWYATDLHVHSAAGSNDTDGTTVADQSAVARERGLALIVITDHSNSAGSMDCGTGDVEDCTNQGPEFPAREAADAESDAISQVVVGVEISPIASLESTSEPTGHIGCLPRPGDPFADVDSAITDRPAGTVPGGNGVDWCHWAGGLAVVNHPFSIAGWIAYDWTSDAYDALEVFNGGARFDANDAQGVDAWMCDWAQGKTTIAVGGSDTHRAGTPTPPEEILDQSLGFPTTWVRSASSERDALLGALAAGQVMVGDPRTELDVVVWDGDQAVGPGETLSTQSDAVSVAVSAEASSADMVLQLIEVREEDCIEDDRWRTGAAPTYLPSILQEEVLDQGVRLTLEMTVDVGTTLVVRVWPQADPGLMGDGVQIAAPVRVVAY